MNLPDDSEKDESISNLRKSNLNRDINIYQNNFNLMKIPNKLDFRIFNHNKIIINTD